MEQGVQESDLWFHSPGSSARAVGAQSESGSALHSDLLILQMWALPVPEWESALPPSFLGSAKEAWTNTVEDTHSFLCLGLEKSDWPEI